MMTSMHRTELTRDGADAMRTDTALCALSLRRAAGEIPSEYTGVYAGDLLSRAMNHVHEGDIWITIMSNINVIAVASLTEAACVILAEGVTMEPPVLAAAEERGVCVLMSDFTVYELCRGLSALEETP